MLKYAIYIHDSMREPFTDYILSGLKTLETRNKNTLRQLIGQHVYIVRTGRGPACIVGSCIITGVKYYTAAELDAMRDQTRIRPGSKYNADRAGKYCYMLDSVTACGPFPLDLLQIVRKNRSFATLDAGKLDAIQRKQIATRYNKSGPQHGTITADHKSDFQNKADKKRFSK